jgi:hypothetical protein
VSADFSHDIRRSQERRLRGSRVRLVSRNSKLTVSADDALGTVVEGLHALTDAREQTREIARRGIRGRRRRALPVVAISTSRAAETLPSDYDN